MGFSPRCTSIFWPQSSPDGIENKRQRALRISTYHTSESAPARTYFVRDNDVDVAVCTKCESVKLR